MARFFAVKPSVFVVWLAIVASAAQAATPTDIESFVCRIADKHWNAISDIESDLVRARKRRTVASNRGSQETTEYRKRAEIERLSAKLAALKKIERPIEPSIVRPYSPGQIGRLTSTNGKVVGVVGDNSVAVSIKLYPGEEFSQTVQLIWVGPDTDGIADDEPISLPSVVEMIKPYDTIHGRLMAFKEFDMSPLRERIKEAIKKK